MAESLPPGWEIGTDEEGDTYYISPDGETQWDPPPVPTGSTLSPRAAPHVGNGVPEHHALPPLATDPEGRLALQAKLTAAAADAGLTVPDPGALSMNPLARIGSSGTKVAPNPPAPADEGGGGVVCGEFVVKETGTVSKALFIPEGARLNSQKLTSLLAQWKKEPPGILISSDAGTVHPKSFAAPKLVALKSFEKYWEDALQHAGMAGGTNSPEETEDFALSVINNVLFLKLVTIFASVSTYVSQSSTLSSYSSSSPSLPP